MNTTTEPITKNSLIERLFAAGAHFGFTKSRRHPTARPYLYGTVQGTDIIDLEKTAAQIAVAKDVLSTLGKDGKTVLLVGTKEEVSRIVREHAERAGLPYVTNRWIGGMLTNFSEIKKRIARLTQLTEEGESGELERKYTKRERVLIAREIEKLRFNFGGMQSLERVPDMLLIVDPRHDSIALQEANDRNIPVIGVMSSDNNTGRVAYPVVVNDALQESVRLVLNELIGAFESGRAGRTETSPVSKGV